MFVPESTSYAAGENPFLNVRLNMQNKTYMYFTTKVILKVSSLSIYNKHNTANKLLFRGQHNLATLG